MGDQDITIGIPLPTSAAEGCQLDLSSVGATAEWAEAAGFDIVWCIDHLFHARQMLESMTTLSYVAGRTRRIKIGTAVYLLALRSVAVASKQIATLSSLSGGRLVMGIGV